MKLFLSALLSLALLFVASLDAAHAAPQGSAVAMTEMPHDDHGTSEMSCCDGLSSRAAPCLGDVFAETPDAAPATSAPTRLRLAPAATVMAVQHLPETPIGPPKA
ncbi:hypothetical protein ILP92_07285 [Maribius pontilimi]|uniref:Uncharacterized protein n=1 Tax=Palleronia pontilimi TaxID=1964209 RepID=A0A934MC96_9RHOB|nr:hypothetical protein [Palleronia pontilimi]MBJ3762543.1 hypothetical protein [Palleronia pontilimi]